MEKPLAWFIVLLFLGLLVRLYKLDSPIADWHSWRQADTASVTRIYADEGLNMLLPRYYDISKIQTGFINIYGYRMVELPLFNLLHLINYRILGSVLSFDATGRLTTVFISLITALALFAIGERTIGKFGGVLTAFFFLFIPYSIYYSRVILPDPLAVCFGTLGLVIFLQYLDKQKNRYLYLSAVLFGLSLLIKPFLAVYILVPLYLLIGSKGHNIFLNSKVFIKYLFALFIVFVPFFLWRAWINNFAVGIPMFEWAFNGDMIRFRPAFWRWIFAERIGNLILGIWGLIPFAFGVVFAKGKKQYSNIAFLGSVILYIAIIATASVKHDYYQIPLIPALALVTAQGTINVWKLKKNYVGKFLLMFSVLMMLFIGWYQIKEYYKINRPEMMIVGEAVQRLIPKDAKIIASLSGDTALLYQTKRFGWPVVDNDIKRLIEWGAQYYVSINFADPDTIAFEKRFETVEKTQDYIILNLKKEIK